MPRTRSFPDFQSTIRRAASHVASLDRYGVDESLYLGDTSDNPLDNPLSYTLDNTQAIL
jgi:hypothetical protein